MVPHLLGVHGDLIEHVPEVGPTDILHHHYPEIGGKEKTFLISKNETLQSCPTNTAMGHPLKRATATHLSKPFHTLKDSPRKCYLSQYFYIVSAF